MFVMVSWQGSWPCEMKIQRMLPVSFLEVTTAAMNVASVCVWRSHFELWIEEALAEKKVSSKFEWWIVEEVDIHGRGML